MLWQAVRFCFAGERYMPQKGTHSMVIKPLPKALRPIGTRSDSVQRLAALRQELESGVGKLHQIEVPAMLLLADVCNALGLNRSEKHLVLGRDNARFLDELSRATVRLTPSPNIRNANGHLRRPR